MAFSKVTLNGTTLMDVTQKTVTANTMLSGTTALKNDGTDITGTYIPSASVDVEPLSVTTNGTYTAPTGTAYSPVTVNVSGGGDSAERKDVNFYDYDGTIVASYATAEFANISALPSNPSHVGLTAQGWNVPSTWTLSDVKTYVATNKMADWGQMYTTTSGATEIDVEFIDPNRMSPIMSLAVDGTVLIDWGDGSSATTVTGTSLTTQLNTGVHTYPAVGKYTIKITATTGSWGFYGTSTYFLFYKNSTANQNRVYSNCVRSIRTGNGCVSIGAYAFNACRSLANITISSSVTSIGTYAFGSCSSLASITIPSSVTSIGTYAFQTCSALDSVTIPNSVTDIGSYAFQNCYSLNSITIPNSATSIGTYAFSSCSSLASITIPSSVASIGTYAFQTCYSLPSITIPDGVTSISSNAFYNCYGLGSIHFKPLTPPTVGASNAFTGLPTDCIIYVPTGKKSNYTGATNYPSSSTYTYIEE